jgi:elongation factor Ts
MTQRAKKQNLKQKYKKVMMMTTQTDIKANLVKLRELTGAGMMDCKKALDESGGDFEKAKDAIRKRGLDIAKKKSSREAKEGQIVSYIHGAGKLGVIVEINCETDFVARNDDFKAFTKEIAMQIAAGHPFYVSRDEIPADVIAKEKELFAEQVAGKPAEVQEKILQGKLEKRYEDICLLDQKYLKDDSKTVGEYINEVIARIGENIIVKRFARFEIGAV